MIVFFIIIFLVIFFILTSEGDKRGTIATLIIGCVVMFLLFLPRIKYSEQRYFSYYKVASISNINLNTVYLKKPDPDNINVEAVINCYNYIIRYNDALMWNVRWYNNPWMGIFFCSKKWASKDFIEPMFESPTAYVDAIRAQYNDGKQNVQAMPQ